MSCHPLSLGKGRCALCFSNDACMRTRPDAANAERDLLVSGKALVFIAVECFQLYIRRL